LGGEDTDHDLTAESKAYLIGVGSVAVDDSILEGGLKTTATAGPGAGGSSIFLASGGHRVRLSINPASPLRMIPRNDDVVIAHGETIIASGMLERPLCHCPHQAYITISERCIFDCAFCPVPKLQGRVKTIEEIVGMVEEAAGTGELRAISLTSGVAESPEQEVRYAVQVVRELRRRYDLPIGVSVYPTKTSSADLFAAGACEIKYNVETMDPEIFARVCPGLSLPGILAALEGAVAIFGRNHVSSNIILGLGETDECVIYGIETLAGMGVIPNLRPISPHPLRKGDIDVTRPSAGRLIRLGAANRDILLRHGLSVTDSRTMCLPCTGCDLVPGTDI
jgi:biotin synthase-related radical SAM superfamily protein